MQLVIQRGIACAANCGAGDATGQSGVHYDNAPGSQFLAKRIGRLGDGPKFPPGRLHPPRRNRIARSVNYR